VNMRHGTMFSVATTASGRIFAAYLDPVVIQTLVEGEFRCQTINLAESIPGVHAPQTSPPWQVFDEQLAEVPQYGLSRSEGWPPRCLIKRVGLWWPSRPSP
jgi:DNA-binding IclR family transcriptional regulator